MALKTRIQLICVILAVGGGLALAYEGWRLEQVRNYNAAVSAGDYAAAGVLRDDAGRFAAAYAKHQAGQLQDARTMYSELARSAVGRVRKDAMYNLANTYMEQALQVDIDKDPDLAVPLIELAKDGYRELLMVDSDYWDARFNLEQALRLLPDALDRKLIELEGRRGTVRSTVSANTQENLP